MTAIRIAVLAAEGGWSQARSAFDHARETAQWNDEPLIAAALGLPVNASRGAPFAAYLVAFIFGELDPASEGVADSALPGLFASDIAHYLATPSVRTAESVEAHRMLAAGEVARRAGFPGVCAVICRRVIQRHPSCVPAYGLLASCILAQDRSLSDDSAFLQSGLPAVALSRFVEALRLVRGGDPAAALSILRELEAANPDHVHLTAVTAAVARNAGRNDEASRRFKSLCVEGNPLAVAAANELALLLADDGELDAAIETARWGLARAPENPALLDTVGWIEHRLGHDDALRHLVRAARSAPDHASVHGHLAQAYAGAGEPSLARAHARESFTRIRRSMFGVAVSATANRFVEFCRHASDILAGASSGFAERSPGIVAVAP